jgi:hypothetical protein
VSVVRAVVLLTAAMAGFAAGTLLRGDDSRPSGEAVRTVAGGGLRLAVPSSWSVTDDARSIEIAGASFHRPIVLDEPKLGLRIVAERLESATESLLPAALERQLRAPRPEPTVRRLASGAEAYAYTGMVRRNGTSELRVHAAPTTAGVATIVCSARRPWPRPSAAQCDAVATSLVVPGTATLPLLPETAFRASLPAVVERLVAARDEGRTGLATADTAPRQAVQAAQVGDAYRAAAAALEPLVYSRRSAPAVTVRFLRQAGRHYDRLAAAARTGDARAYRTAAARIARADKRLDAVVAWLRADARGRVAAASSRP